MKAVMAAAPIQGVLNDLDNQIEVRGQYPDDPSLLLIKRFRKDLEEAITRAQDVEVWASTAEAAAMLGVSPERVRQLCRKGDLVHTRLGKPYRIRIDSIENRKTKEAA